MVGTWPMLKFSSHSIKVKRFVIYRRVYKRRIKWKFIITNNNNNNLKQKRENMHTDTCGNTCRQKFVQKEAEKKLKYKSLCIEIQRMWNLKCKVIPIIIGAIGIVTRSLRKNLEAVPEKHSTDSLQKTAILGTSHIIRKVLQCEA